MPFAFSESINVAIIAGVISLIVATITQIISVYNQRLSHKLSQQREDQKYYSEVYRNLFAPIINDVFLYADIMTNYRRNHDVKANYEWAIKDKIVDFIRDNLVYAGPRIINAYHEVIRYNIGDESGIFPNTHEINLFYEFVVEYEDILKNISIYNSSKKQPGFNVRYKIIYFIWNRLGSLQPTRLLLVNYLFKDGWDNEFTFRRVRNILDKYDDNKIIIMKLKKLLLRKDALQNSNMVDFVFDDLYSDWFITSHRMGESLLAHSIRGIIQNNRGYYDYEQCNKYVERIERMIWLNNDVIDQHHKKFPEIILAYLQILEWLDKQPWNQPNASA